MESLEFRTMLSAAPIAAPAAKVTPAVAPVARSPKSAGPVELKPVAKPTAAAAAVFRAKPVAPRRPVAGKLPPKPTTAPKPLPPVSSPAPTPPADVPLLPGDADGDGKVDTTDFKIVNDHLGQAVVGRGLGDLNGDGLVSIIDFQIVELNFGKVLPREHYATVGTNLDGIAEYSTIGAFVDLARMFRQWGRATSSYQSDLTIPRTPDNYPLEDAGAITYARTYPDGVYKVSWDGQADLSFVGMGASLTITSHVDDHWTADLSLNHAQGDILSVYVKNISQASPLHNLHIISPDVDYSISDTFRPVFLNKLAAFNGPLRMMDWVQTNENPIVEWADRTRPERFTYVSDHDPTTLTDNGVDYETLAKLANTAHKDLWINVPLHASDDFVQQMARLFRDQLDPSLKLYVECSNEVWNTGFLQGRENVVAARADTDLTKPDDFSRAAQEAGKQIVRVSNLFRAEYPAAQFAGQVRPVFGAFIASSYWAKTALEFIQLKYGAPSNFISSMAISPYVGVTNDLRHVDNASLTAIALFDWMHNFIDRKLVPWIQENKQVADRFGLALHAYEGGQALDATNGKNEAIKQAAQDDPRMGDVYRHLIRAWHDNSGGGIFGNFALATPYSPYGYWGPFQSIDQTTTVKWEALLSTIAP